MSLDLRFLEPRRILIIKPSALGDVVQASAILPALRARFPRAELHWVIKRELQQLLAERPELHSVIPFERHGTWKHWIGLLRAIRKLRPDVVLDLQGLARTALMTAVSGARVRIGLQTAREGARYTYSHVVPGSGWDVAAYERYRAAARFLQADPEAFPETPQASAATPEGAWVRRQLQELPRPLVVIHPGARWETKRWPAARFAVVAAKAVRHLGAAIGLVGGSDDVAAGAEIELLLRELAPHAAVRNWIDRTDLRRLAALLHAADVVLCNDSGPMHLAAREGTPVVAVFTCTSPRLSGPPGPGHRFIGAEIDCAGGYHKRCPLAGKAHLACMDAIRPDQVYAEVAAVLSRESRRAG
ncbi:MAG: glycosyltransferase family 9 protein [Planctomycetota bacterium]|nr:MAG: glycosyltransferase family 9 protein [Planctomycetota bacterium]